MLRGIIEDVKNITLQLTIGLISSHDGYQLTITVSHERHACQIKRKKNHSMDELFTNLYLPQRMWYF